MSYNCFSISQKLCSSVEGATISLLSKIMHFLQKVQLCYSCLIEKGLEGLRMTKDSYIWTVASRLSTHPFKYALFFRKNRVHEGGRIEDKERRV
jgi:hypothetical protein